jgi:hypothetical protein
MGNVCGAKWNEKFRDYTITVKHTSQDMKLIIKWNIDENTDNESGGFS